ncbi:MAG: hypothetical protein KME15_14655 [Drouetiella hepatica Uher 2000/2452]|jgi:hypothetical protein|uniref:Uncharacterized protein n=1 Tax=Drouetiella hepatica Uher 2000/2452 TaxID=904376 RepID=A0A951QEG3_9CYAN|nr:hypothetical protein [Drouetiella hepatica Uher 2000/2452]
MFVDRGSSGDSDQPPMDSFVRFSPNDEPVKMTLTASRQAVDRMILLLHNRNIIAGSEWSHPVEIKNTGEFISVASRRIQVE